jgi:TolA-binding protein
MRLTSAKLMGGLVLAQLVMGAQAHSQTGEANRRASEQQGLSQGRSNVALPQSEALAPTRPKPKSLADVKPPKTDDFYEGSDKEIEYEQALDREIKALFDLANRQKRSPVRGEIWLRLAQRYIDKAQMLEFRAQRDYEKRLKEYLENRKGPKPVVDTRAARDFNKRAIRLNEMFVQEFPKDPRLDQALFFLGYNHFESGNTAEGERYYKDLVRRFPNSVFIAESNFALGEFYFENDRWKEALEQYTRVIQRKSPRLLSFARYKAAWCLFRLGRSANALKLLEQVIQMSRAGGKSQSEGGRAINKVRLGAEAIRDYVPFYAEGGGDPKRAWTEFSRIAGDEKLARAMLERLAYNYADAGQRDSARELFRQLIGTNPTAEKAAEYQYQIVLAYASADPKEFRAELTNWLDNYGSNSLWARQNAKNQKLVSDVARLQEITLRNHVLQLHQAAQNSRAAFSQQQAQAAYAQYIRSFPQSAQIVEMQFFHAELLFDMGRFDDAAKIYTFVADREPQGKYRERAITNAVLALEKQLPSEAELKANRADRSEKMPLDPRVQQFESAARRYLAAYPQGEKSVAIQRILGALYLQHNHYDEAQAIFERIIRDRPGSPDAEVAGDLLLQGFERRKDASGLVAKGQELLANPQIANSKFGSRIRDILERATFVKAEGSIDKDALKGAREFEEFANQYKGSALAAGARYKAATAYERGGDLVSAIRMYQMVLNAPAPNDELRTAQVESRNSLARLFQQTGQLEQAARLYAQVAASPPRTEKSLNGYFNAAVIFEALGDRRRALENYRSYFEQSRKADRLEALWRMAEVSRRANDWGQAIRLYEEYGRQSGRREARVAEAAHRIAGHHRDGRRAGLHRQWRQQVLDVSRRVPREDRDAVAGFMAEARFELSQGTLDEIRAIRYSDNEKQQAESAQRVVKLKQKYIADMAEVIKLDNAPMIVAALTSTGGMIELIIQGFARIPTPKGYSGEDAQRYRQLIQGQIDQFRAEAKQAYSSAIERAMTFEYYGSWLSEARRGLARVEPTSPMASTGEIVMPMGVGDWMGL